MTINDIEGIEVNDDRKPDPLQEVICCLSCVAMLFFALLPPWLIVGGILIIAANTG